MRQDDILIMSLDCHRKENRTEQPEICGESEQLKPPQWNGCTLLLANLCHTNQSMHFNADSHPHSFGCFILWGLIKGTAI